MPSFTRKAIMESFMKLLDTRPLNKITIKDIVEECGINRNTFYYHFEDIPALVEAIFKEETDGFISAHASVASLEEGLLLAVDFILKYRRAILHIYNSPSREVYERYLMQMCEYIASRMLDTMLAGRRIAAADHDVIVSLYKCLSYGLFIDWLNDGLQGNLQPRIARLVQLRGDMLEETIRRCAAV